MYSLIFGNFLYGDWNVMGWLWVGDDGWEEEEEESALEEKACSRATFLMQRCLGGTYTIRAKRPGCAALVTSRSRDARSQWLAKASVAGKSRGKLEACLRVWQSEAVQRTDRGTVTVICGIPTLSFCNCIPLPTLFHLISSLKRPCKSPPLARLTLHRQELPRRSPSTS